MGISVVVWDLETVPDLKGFAAANGLEAKTNDEDAIAKLNDATVNALADPKIRQRGGAEHGGAAARAAYV
jgi:hypothetical protein